MGLKRFKEIGNTGFSNSWEDKTKDMRVTFESGEVRRLRYLDVFLPLQYHWIPFIKKQSAKPFEFYKDMCLLWDIEKSEWLAEAECPACDGNLSPQEHSVNWVIDIDALAKGNTKDLLKYVVHGPSERRQLDGLAKFNIVSKTPIAVADDKHGVIVCVVYDKSGARGEKWRFNTNDPFRVQLNKDITKVKLVVPKGMRSVDRDLWGKVFVLDIPNIFDYVFSPSLAEYKDKFQRMRVPEAIERYHKARKRKSESEERNPTEKRGKRSASPRTAGRKEQDDWDAGEDEDQDQDNTTYEETTEDNAVFDDLDQEKDEDGFADEEVADGFGDTADDEDFDSEEAADDDEVEGEEEESWAGEWDEEEEEEKPKPKSKPQAQRAKPKCARKAPGPKCPLHKRCYGHMGEKTSEDCPNCPHRPGCAKVTK